MVAFGLGCFALASLCCPNRAYAEWVEISGSSTYFVNSADVPSAFNVGATSESHKVGYGTPIVGYFYTGGSQGHVYTSVPSVSTPVVVVRVGTGSGVLAEGQIVQLKFPEQLTIRHAPANATLASAYETDYVAMTNFRYWAVADGGGRRQELYPNANGTFTMPFDSVWFFVTANVTSLAGYSGEWWYSNSTLTVGYERPEQQDEVAAINSQTQQLMSTDGADSGIGGYTSQVTTTYEGLQPVQMLTTLTDTVREQVMTTESDSSIVFPGMSIAGFVLPSYEVDPMQLAPESVREPIRMMVTLVFVIAFLRHIWGLIDMIFGIHDYGGGVADFGMGSYDKGYTVVRSTPDYGVDEDLGF